MKNIINKNTGMEYVDAADLKDCEMYELCGDFLADCYEEGYTPRKVWLTLDYYGTKVLDITEDDAAVIGDTHRLSDSTIRRIVDLYECYMKDLNTDTNMHYSDEDIINRYECAFARASACELNADQMVGDCINTDNYNIYDELWDDAVERIKSLYIRFRALGWKCHGCDYVCDVLREDDFLKNC